MTSALIVIQVVGVLLAAGFAFDEIESIVFSGPVLSLTSLVIAAASFRACRPAGFYFGLATPTFAILCFAVICGQEWSPAEAQRPVSRCSAVFAIGLALAGIRASIESRQEPRAARPRRLQFSIAALLWLTLFTAVLLSLFRISAPLRFADPQTIAWLTLAVYAVAVGYVVRWFHRGWLPKTEPDDPAPPPGSHSLPVA